MNQSSLQRCFAENSPCKQIFLGQSNFSCWCPMGHFSPPPSPPFFLIHSGILLVIQRVLWFEMLCDSVCRQLGRWRWCRSTTLNATLSVDLAVLKASIVHSELPKATTSTFHWHPVNEAFSSGGVFTCRLSLSFGLTQRFNEAKHLQPDLLLWNIWTASNLQILCSWYDSEIWSVPVHSLVNIWT